MKAIIIRPDLDVNMVDLEEENLLEQLQEIVGGNIEVPYLSDVFSGFELLTVINEEGKLIEGLKPSMAITDGESGDILDVVFGPVVILGHDYEGNFKGLKPSQSALFSSSLMVAENYASVHRVTGEKTVFFGFPAELNIERILNELLDDEE